MAVMKQMETCMERFFNGMEPLKKKWFATLHPNGANHIVYLFHYHHLVLVYDFHADTILYQWWERDADKRGLDSALEWLVTHKETTKRFRPSD